MITEEVKEALVEKEVFEDISAAMAPWKYKCEWDGCQYVVPKMFEPEVALDILILHAKARHAYNPEGEYDTDTDKGGNYNARTVQELSLDTDHYEGCWEESQPCQGEYDTDTDNGDNYGHDMETTRSARIARKETPDEATDVSLEHWGRGAELVGDQVTRLERHVESHEDVEESSGAEVAAEKPSQDLEGKCQPGQFL